MNYLLISTFNIYEDILKNNNYLLCIENKHFLYLFLSDLNSYCCENEYIRIFDENDKQLKCVDYIEFLPSLFHIDLNTKRNVNALLRRIKSNSNEYLTSSLTKIRNEIESLFSIIKLDFPLDILSNIAISEDDLLKLLNLSINDESQTLLERIITYIKISYELRKINVFIFYGLSVFLNYDEISNLLHECKYLGIKLINIESSDINIDSFDKKKILDSDGCLLE